MNLNIVHVVRDLELASGGPSRSVPALADAQGRMDGIRVSVLFGDRGRPMMSVPGDWVEFRALRNPVWNPCRRLRPAIESSIAAHASTVLHLHGLWSPVLQCAAGFARRHRIPYVVSTRGMMAGWAMGHKALKKKVAWHLYQKANLRRAASLVASSAFEAADVQSVLPGCTVAVIPNGCEPAPEQPSGASGLPGPEETRWAFALGRLHPVKGYAELIDVWAALRPDGWKLAIAGPDENGFRAVLESMIKDRGLREGVFLLGAVDDLRKWSLLSRCELFVAPSQTENFGMAIAEALQSGTPVVTTTGTPWRDLVEYDCGWWVPANAASLGEALRTATESDSDTLGAMGLRARRLVTRRYSWESIARRSIELYRSILDPETGNE